jgi:thiamine pyrophosphate-dependent acetolactate synthase large subunit-like protein
VLARSDYHAVVQGFGAVGFVIRRQAEVESVLQQARTAAASGRPALVNVWLDRTEFREGSISM